ncbi:MAG: leucine--tRNA ligase [Phycisphaerales bacterium]|jgi:leucyl-tRNA synthetase|nr:leucine--tRNA ligase [Phycisphaerales bacterium]
MPVYDFGAIEPKWQKYWEENGTFVQPNPGQPGFVDKPKLYVLDMFPYPSGAGLHVGHPEGYTATDIVCRHARMKGYNVLHPMGYDSFGLPAEQYAVEHGVHPAATTDTNVANIERQIKMFGFSYDWSRRLATTDVKYYRWTQWIFLQLFDSWYDPDAEAARPISELIDSLESGQLVLDMFGAITTPPAGEDLSAIVGTQGDLVRFTDLDDDQRREVIDAQRLAYLDDVPVNWCPALGTVLSNEEVTNDGRSDRGDHPVFKRNLKQWMLRITAYCDRLLDDVDALDWPESVKIMQRNWIGKSEGAEVSFAIDGSEELIDVYTTRPDTLFGATYMVLAPEHALVKMITTPECRAAVDAYVETAAGKSELERTTEAKDKTGQFTGAYAINPVNDAKIPIWVADYVMMGYGTGAIMAVPAHDTRDFEFATKFDLPIIQVVTPPEGVDWQGYVGDGVAINSGPYDGLTTPEFKEKIIEKLEDDGVGQFATNYKLRDWLFSRQRYWGEPFPIVHCPNCHSVPLGAADLPLELPEMEDFSPTVSDDPEAPPAPPLGKAADWGTVPCPICGTEAKRELNTMPQWAGSCWYYLRYLDPDNEENFCDPEIEKYWMGTSDDNPLGGVDLYIGGAEHAVLHLLYARFWHKVLFDLGHVTVREPFGKLFNQGMIRSFAYRDSRGVYVGYDDIDTSGDKPIQKSTGGELSESVEKMSKSLKNVVNPDDVIADYGADTFRLYEMFMGPLDASKPWNTRDIPGMHRFLKRVWRMIAGDEDADGNVTPSLMSEAPGDEDIERHLHKLIKKVGEDYDALKFNTAIAALTEFVNAVYRTGKVAADQAERFLLLLAPMAPHICEELWSILGRDTTLTYEPWPVFDEKMLVVDTVELAVQINGKLKGRINVAAETSNDEILAAAKADPKVAAAIEGKNIVKEIVVPNRMVNLVVK